MSNQKYNSEKSLKNAFDNLEMGFDQEAFAKFEQALDQEVGPEPVASKPPNNRELLGLFLLALLLMSLFFGYQQFVGKGNLVAKKTANKQSKVKIENTSSPTASTNSTSESVQNNKVNESIIQENNNSIKGSKIQSKKTATNKAQSNSSLKSNLNSKNDEQATVSTQAFNPNLSNTNTIIHSATIQADLPTSQSTKVEGIDLVANSQVNINTVANTAESTGSTNVNKIVNNEYSEASNAVKNTASKNAKAHSINDENSVDNTITNKGIRTNLGLQLSQVAPLDKINAQLSHIQIEYSEKDLFAQSNDAEKMSEAKDEKKSQSSKKKTKRKKNKRKLMSITDIYQLTKERGYFYGGLSISAYRSVVETNQLEFLVFDKKYDYTLKACLGYQFNENLSVELSYMPTNYKYYIDRTSNAEYDLFKSSLVGISMIHAIHLVEDQILITPRLGYTYGMRSNKTDLSSADHTVNSYGLIETGLGLQGYFARRWSANINYSYFSGLKTITSLNYITINEGVSVSTKGSFTAIELGLRYDLNFRGKRIFK